MVAPAFSSLFFVLFVSSARGTAILRRDDGCRSFPTSGVPNNNNAFELWAQFEDKSTIPLALSTFSTSTTNVQEVYLAPTGLAGEIVANLFTLKNSGLVSSGSSDDSGTNTTWVSNSVDAGGPFPFSLSDPTVDDGIAEDYCEVANTDPAGSIVDGPLLAADGATDGWAICNRTDNAQYQGVVFQPASYSSDYDFDFTTCQNVAIYLRSSALGNAP
ncbi:hypothetical protein BDP27DRAFT_1367372 [Rhodocollybia butyracea]|uniref:Uncharacterized protein n=1 Tax=Rhodocollybia butyracea TaxID=206335 RepID=A0A9P5U375_9AGAR|nr:hypothetical protein BDP27DRAFT_1367372 [Rhodocollybia butyracea]